MQNNETKQPYQAPALTLFGDATALTKGKASWSPNNDGSYACEQEDPQHPQECFS